MKRTALALLAALAAAPIAANAGDLSYSYLEAGYLRADPDDFGAEDGFGLHGSGAITDNLHAFAGYDRISIDLGGDDFNLSNTRIGLGWNQAVSDNVDLVARVAWERVDADEVDDGNGYSVEVGVRGAITPNFEGSAAVRYTDIEDSDDTQLVLGAQYKFSPTWGLVAEAGIGSDGNTVFVGPRVSF
jgi:Ax21 family sulfation-dependent quorum factor